MKKTRFIPYGYTIRDGRTVIEHTEADVIRQIFNDYINGSSLKEIAEDLTARRVPYTEKTSVWDKARIARIIDNAKYTGFDDYDPIIDEEIYEEAVNAKISRQRGVIEHECEAINCLRNRVKCTTCGSQMVRRICSKNRIKESWICTNDECGSRARISDTDLIQKITVIINRIIANSELMLPKPKLKPQDSLTVEKYQADILTELSRERPSEEYVVARIGDIATQLYKETQAKQMIVAQIARKRAMLMEPQSTFNSVYFSDLIAYVSLDSSGKVTLHTKTETDVEEGEHDLEC